jgi:hypothetical protein
MSLKVAAKSVCSHEDESYNIADEDPQMVKALSDKLSKWYASMPKTDLRSLGDPVPEAGLYLLR